MEAMGKIKRMDWVLEFLIGLCCNLPCILQSENLQIGAVNTANIPSPAGSLGFSLGR